MSDYEAYQLINSLDSSSSSLDATMGGFGVWALIAIILAIVGGILVYFLFVKSKTEPKGKFAKWLKDFLAFKIMWLEPILKVVYYIATIFVILYSFSFLGMVGLMGGVAIIMFFATLILGPIFVRIMYALKCLYLSYLIVPDYLPSEWLFR